MLYLPRLDPPLCGSTDAAVEGLHEVVHDRFELVLLLTAEHDTVRLCKGKLIGRESGLLLIWGGRHDWVEQSHDALACRGEGDGYAKRFGIVIKLLESVWTRQDRKMMI